MAWRFVPPPGWPVPPGFVPPQGWVPDPQWPPAPVDWPFWSWDEPIAAAPQTWAQPVLQPVPQQAQPFGQQTWGPPLAAQQQWGAPVSPVTQAGGDPFAAPYGATPTTSPRGGLPGWAIALFIALVVALIAGIVGVGALAIGRAGDAIGSFTREFDAEFNASIACDEATDVFDLRVAGETITPTAAITLDARLRQAQSSAISAADAAERWRPLSDAIRDARDALTEIKALPRDTTSWAPAEEQASVEAVIDFDTAGAAIQGVCVDVFSGGEFEEDRGSSGRV